MKETSAFVVVTKRNLASVAKILKKNGGFILITDPAYFTSPADKLTGDCEIHLFNSPQINVKQATLFVKHGTKMVGEVEHQTGWEKHREYRLYPKPVPSKDSLWEQARKLFTSLGIDDKYQFKIAGNFIASREVCDSGDLSLYVPEFAILPKAFDFGLTWMTDLFNVQSAQEKTRSRCPKFTREHIEAMIAYAMDDLKTGAVLKHNVQAGQDADAMVGLA